MEHTGLLAHRASLQLADISYGERAHFDAARKYYEICHDASGSIAFTPLEVDHIRRQLDRLDRYSANRWEALRMVNNVSRGDWAQAKMAIERLFLNKNTDLLVPEAVREIIHRLRNGPRSKPDSGITAGLNNLLASRIEEEQNREIRAWLEITVAEIVLVHAEDYEQAIVHFRRAKTLSDDSSAANYAGARLDKLIDLRQLNQIR